MSKHRRSSRHAAAPAARVDDKPLRDAPAPAAVAFRLQRLEPSLLWAISAFTLWMTVVLYAAEPAAWVLALLGAVLGAWAQASPARRMGTLFLRATLLLAGGFMLQVSAAGAVGGSAFAWPVMVSVVYSLLLSRNWSIALWSMAGVDFIAARLLGTTPGNWQAQLAEFAVLVTFTYVAAQYGRSARELDAQSDLARRDRNSRLYNETGFFTHGGELFDDCRRRKRPFSMVLLNSADLREVSSLAGKKAANQLFAELVQSVDAATPAEGLAARTDAVEFGMALPGLSAAKAASLLHQKLGQPPKVEVMLKGTRVTVMLDSVVAEATSDVATLEDMYDRLRGKLLARSGVEPTRPSDIHSTLQGMLEPDSVIPRNARPTMPMEFASDVTRPAVSDRARVGRAAGGRAR